MIYQLLVVGTVLVSTSAVSIKNLQKKTHAKVQAAAMDFHALPSSFLEAGYGDEDFHSWNDKQADSRDMLSAPTRPTARQVITKFDQIAFYDHDYKFEPQYENEMVAPSLLETEEASDTPVGEDFRISKHGRTNDVNDPDYEINHPTNTLHTKNVIGTKQEGHLFWTDTTQPNPDTYESTHDEAIRTANTVEADDQAFAVEDEEDVEENATQIVCEGCEATAHSKPEEK